LQSNNSKKLKKMKTTKTTQLAVKQRLLAQIEKLEARFLTLADADFYYAGGLFSNGKEMSKKISAAKG
jgi:hypothetical protein